MRLSQKEKSPSLEEDRQDEGNSASIQEDIGKYSIFRQEYEDKIDGAKSKAANLKASLE